MKYHLDDHGRAACQTISRRIYSHGPTTPLLIADPHGVECMRCQKTHAFHVAIKAALAKVTPVEIVDGPTAAEAERMGVRL